MGYVFLLPALILFMVVVAYPVFNTLKTSFYSIRVQNIATGGKWVGLANYKQLIQDPNTWVTLKFTLLFTVVSVILEIVIGMGCALIMNIGMRGEGMDKTGIRGFQYNIRLAVMFLKQVLRILSQVAGFTNYKGKRTNILKFQHGERMTIRLALVRYVNL